MPISGRRSSLDIYDINQDGYTLAEDGSRSAATSREDGNEDKLEPKMSALQHCTIRLRGRHWPQRGGAADQQMYYAN